MKKLPMNLPNKITLIRIALIPFFLVLMGIEGNVFRWLGVILFSVAALTDMLDGELARRRNEVTDFGKFMDPIADKLLVLLPMILLTHAGPMHQVWAVMLMVAREIIVSGFRLVAVNKGSVIAAAKSGKIKTTVQVVAVILLTLGSAAAPYCLWVAALLSVYSGGELLLKNIHILEEKQ